MISEVIIKNFRNIRYAAPVFKEINILTGKNSSGKSNFLELLEKCLVVKQKNLSSRFDNNITTVSKGVKTSEISYTFGDKIKRISIEITNMIGSAYDIDSISIDKGISKQGDIKKETITVKGRFLREVKVIDLTKDIIAKNIKDEEHVLKIIMHELDKGDVIHDLILGELAKEKKETIVINIPVTQEKQEEGLNININQSALTKFEQAIISITKNLLNRQGVCSLLTYDKNNVLFNSIFKKATAEDEEKAYKNIKGGKNVNRNFLHFSKSNLLFLLSDIQRSEKDFKLFNKDLSIFTEGILEKVEISTAGMSKGEVIVHSPNGSQDYNSISTGTAVILYCIILKNWLNLNYNYKSFSNPNILLFDEIDSYLHPTLISSFAQILKKISNSCQIFFASHSAQFIKEFNRENIYIFIDSPGDKNSCSIMNYDKIIKNLPKQIGAQFENIPIDKLFTENYLEDLAPNKIKDGEDIV